MAGSYAIRDVEKAVVPQWPDPFPAIRAHSTYQQAKEHLEFAVSRGDPYLKPRAQVRLAILLTGGGKFDEARELLHSAESAVGGIAIRDEIQKVRDEVANTENLVSKHQGQHETEATPSGRER